MVESEKGRSRPWMDRARATDDVVQIPSYYLASTPAVRPLLPAMSAATPPVGARTATTTTSARVCRVGGGAQGDDVAGAEAPAPPC